MPQIPKHRKVKKATVLIKRARCLRNYPKNKSYKPLYEKLKTNNNSLARALSKEKQECQLLFSQNVALVAEVHNLGVACSKRDKIISHVLNNAKQMLTMLVSITGYVTNTISTCQEFVSATNTNLRMSCSSAGKKESVRRLSTKSPARGVVKPMVSGHTITKPTINLSRVNMQNINNPSGLNTIQEISTTPNRSHEVDIRSPVAISMRQLRYESGRTCRMPERLTVVSPTANEEDERRLSKRSSRHVERRSARYSRPKSSRLESTNHVTRQNTDHTEHVGSPRVKLNDVSKLLQNSQTINIRTLVETRNDLVNESSENSDVVVHESSETNIIIPETQVSINYTEDDADSSKEQMKDGYNEKTSNVNCHTLVSNKRTENNSSDMEDPLEGPSWMFSNSVSYLENRELETDQMDISNSNRSTPSTTLKITALNVANDNAEDTEEASSLSKLTKSLNRIQNHSGRSLSRQDSSSTSSDSECNISFNDKTEDDDLCAPAATTDSDENVNKPEDDPTLNLARFVTHRRGRYEVGDESIDDFTLMFMRNQQRNIQFDINDLRLPVLEGSVINPTNTNEPEPEITTTIQRITQNCPIPSLSDINADEPTFDQMTVKLPLILNTSDYNRDSIPVKNKQESQKRKRRVKSSLSDVTNHIDYSPSFNRENSKQKKKGKNNNNKDPSAAKVVLQKLNDTHVKQRTPSPEEVLSRESSRSSRRSPVSSRADNSSDSESSSASVSSRYTLNRPRRRKAPVNLQEPNLVKKLRRNQ